MTMLRAIGQREDWTSNFSMMYPVEHPESFTQRVRDYSIDPFEDRQDPVEVNEPANRGSLSTATMAAI